MGTPTVEEFLGGGSGSRPDHFNDKSAVQMNGQIPSAAGQVEVAHNAFSDNDGGSFQLENPDLDKHITFRAGAYHVGGDGEYYDPNTGKSNDWNEGFNPSLGYEEEVAKSKIGTIAVGGTVFENSYGDIGAEGHITVMASVSDRISVGAQSGLVYGYKDNVPGAKTLEPYVQLNVDVDVSGGKGNPLPDGTQMRIGIVPIGLSDVQDDSVGGDPSDALVTVQVKVPIL